MIFVDETNCGARFSDCRAYRYTLWRRWVDGCPLSRMVAFIGLNPSTADETVNDPTVKRCINFADHWGYDGMVMLNLFALRATEPSVMKASRDPVGSSNDEAIVKVVASAAETVFAWGVHGQHHDRSKDVLSMIRLMPSLPITSHLGRTLAGHPKHPLYLRADTVRKAWW